MSINNNFSFGEAANEDTSNNKLFKRENSYFNTSVAQRRIGRSYSVNYMNFKNNLYKVIIPYDFDKNRYVINQKDIEFYENKEYVLDTLETLCENPLFNIEQKLKLEGCKKFLYYLPYILVLITLVYIFLFIIFTVFLNPAIIFIMIYVVKKLHKSFKMMRFIFREKLKMKKINQELDKENNTTFCKDHKIKWVLGQSGYWIEVIKLV